MKKVILILTVGMTFLGMSAQKNKRGRVPAVVGMRKKLPEEKPGLTREELKQQLFRAAAEGDRSKVRALIEQKKISPNIRDDYGNTPLHVARDYSTVRLLLNLGAQINAQNDKGLTKLHEAVVFGRRNIVELLVDKGADVKLATTDGVTPLHLATMISYFENPEEFKKFVEPLGAFIAIFSAMEGVLLLSAGLFLGAGVEAASVAAILSLMAAAAAVEFAKIDIKDRNAIVNKLLRAGANPNAQTKAGNTPLHILASGPLLKPTNRHGGVLMAKHLTLNGARRDIINNRGETPHDVARENNRLLLLPFLKPGLPHPIERGAEKAREIDRKLTQPRKLKTRETAPANL